MTDAAWPRVADVLGRALDLPPAERPTLLDAACRRPDGTEDAALREEVQALLDASDAADLDGALVSPISDLVPPTDDVGPGARVGPWRLTSVLGEGGQGVVYAAERADGLYERRVALKRLRSGPGRRRLATRLRTERQTLARLEHPGIARLYDGGLGDDGVPYLVMELVEGVPITEWAEGASLRERVRVFSEVCRAVAFAHARLVVHRDLKPSNVFVVGDGGWGSGVRDALRPRLQSPAPNPQTPHPKLLDFGIARLLDADATETASRAMTPAYAAPEQRASGEVTTATDVYSLGVVLYEVLTGRRPHDVPGAETPPAPPSAHAPGVDRDLDAVVLAALAHDPERRTASADALADDLGRWLDGLAVRARAETMPERARRFVRRHRAAVTAASVAVLALVVGLGAALWQAGVAGAERDRAEVETAKAEAVNGFLTAMLGASDPTEDGQGVRVADLLERASADADSVFAGQPEVEAAVRVALGTTFMELSRHADAERELRRAVALYDRTTGPVSPGAVGARGMLGEAYLAAARYSEADSVLSAALRAERALDRAEGRTLAHLLANLGVVRYYEGDLDGLIVAQREAIEILERLPDADPLEIAAAQGNVATALTDLDRFDEAIPLMERRVALYRRALPAGNLSTARALNGLASALFRAGRTADALPVQAEAVETMRAALAGSADEPVELVRVVTNHVTMLLDAGQITQAERAQADAEALAEAFRTPNAALAHVLYTRAALLDQTGKPAQAARVAARSAAVASAAVGPRSREAADGWAMRGRALLHAGQREAAAQTLRQARSIFAELYGEAHAETAAADSLLRRTRQR